MLDQLIRRSKVYDESKKNFGPVEPIFFEFTEKHGDNSSMLLPHTELLSSEHKCAETSTYALTDHAFSQVCRRLGAVAWPGSQRSLPADYLMACPPDMRAKQLNYWRAGVTPDRKWFVRTYEDTCRAVLTDRYSTVDVTETLEWIQQALDSKPNPDGYEIMRPVVTPDVMYLRIGQRNVDTGNGQMYAMGAFVMTGETGNRGIAAYPFIQRHSCTNSIYVPLDAWSFSSNHIGNRHILRSLFISSIFRAFEGAVLALDKLLDAENRVIDNFTEHVDNLVKECGWTTVVRDQILLGSEGGGSLFHLVNGITSASQKVRSVDVRVDMELFAGSLLI